MKIDHSTCGRQIAKRASQFARINAKYFFSKVNFASYSSWYRSFKTVKQQNEDLEKNVSKVKYKRESVSS